MQFWIIQSLNSLALGGVLFLLASGFSLIFGLMRIANLSHGAYFMLGAYVGANLCAPSASSLWTAALARRLRRRACWAGCSNVSCCAACPATLGQVLVTLGISFIIADACLVVWGGDPIPVPTPSYLAGAAASSLGFAFPTYRLVVVGMRS